MEQWVVTYRIEPLNGDQYIISEFYRGEPAECLRIYRQSGAGEDDRYRTEQPWQVDTCPAHLWDNMLRGG